jgi:hypothetical protein
MKIGGIDRGMNKGFYSTYMRSAAWAAIRRQIWIRAGWACERCGVEWGRGSLECHHLDYRRLGRELPMDLVLVCEGCHDFLHGRRVDDPSDLIGLDPDDVIPPKLLLAPAEESCPARTR